MNGVAEATARLEARCRRAEDEYPRLAAPDGTVAVPIGDLRLLLNAASAIDARQRPDTEEWLDPKGESAAPQEDAQTQSLYSLKDVG